MSKNTIAIVTGHTRGLGAALAETLLARDIRLLALSRNTNAALAARYSGKLEEVELDLTDLDALGRWLEGDALRTFIGDADQALLVNNAGMLAPIGALADQNAATIARAVSVNVAAPLMFAAAFAAQAAHVADKRIAHISSGAARNAYPGWSVYCATKAALDHHARAVALDSEQAGDRTLRICSVAPGVVDTDMQAEIRSTGLERFPLRERFDALKRDGQLATPRQSSEKLIAYLLSDAFGSAAIADVRELG
ncbi:MULTISPECIES: SDR family oxidoreductase [unclassified Caballeronia]|uniref:SDR family oxidoreductase n=1 Tax=unclassified Caballeronia TaxID=2646786 RepID=UPI002028E4DB|nr:MULTISPECIES: SDR family oxidoreductase [unclassified Caballeronia]MDR5771245.1 SDR family oxidoreductase [Caballeronia sp. LZ002]MDR5846681.1 SDR family oxidoreductase [Caballeronia sp. LZ003]